MQGDLKRLDALGYYSKKFQRVRVDRAHGIAPHKPILLLSVIEHIQKKSISENKIFLTSALIQTFLKYWVYLGSPTHNPDISKPFFHMKSGKFWHLWPNPKFEKILSSKIKLKTFAEVKRAIKYAYLDEDLFELLQDLEYCESLSRIIVSRWFPGRWALVKQIGSSQPLNDEVSALMQYHGKFYSKADIGDWK
ncbi:MAG: hypothetical protein AAF152_02955 [Cyanobacteria bacterium P01_A01_bin.114]